MSRKLIWILTIIISLASIGLVMVQSKWIRLALHIKQDQFVQTTGLAMEKIITEVEKQETVLQIVNEIKPYATISSGSEPKLSYHNNVLNKLKGGVRTRQFNQEVFTIDRIDADTYIISEYRHWEETHCYLLNGNSRSLLIDTGLGICDISEEVKKLTDKPVTAVATHIHWDHIGGHKYYPDFYAHEAELDWLSGGFPLSMDTIRSMVIDRCDLPDGYDVSTYELFQGTPTRILHDYDVIDIGGRIIEILHTPGHSPGHMCFWEKDRGYLFTGDLVYKDTLFAYYPSTDPEAYLKSLEKISILPVKRVFPAHHSLDIHPEILVRMQDAFRQLKQDGKLHHGSGTFHYGDWAVWL